MMAVPCCVRHFALPVAVAFVAVVGCTCPLSSFCCCAAKQYSVHTDCAMFGVRSGVRHRRVEQRWAPRRVVPLDANPLTRWSVGMKWPSTQSTTTHSAPRFDAVVGMGGCSSAFNATNAIRTTLFFGCSQGPHLLSVDAVKSIRSLQQREATVQDSPCAAQVYDTLDASDTGGTIDPNSGSRSGGALLTCGRAAFDAMTDLPLVVFENFVAGATSIHSVRIGSSSTACQTPRRLMIGHENNGVDPVYLDARCRQRVGTENGAPPLIVFIPQYGTISSLNVVTCLGIGLFNCWLDATAPGARALLRSAAGDAEACNHVAPAAALFASYAQTYQQLLPHANTKDNGVRTDSTVVSPPCADRLDPRPIHPMFYGLEHAAIQTLHNQFLCELAELEWKGGVGTRHTPVAARSMHGRPVFGLSVFYENDFDQRNFGGLVRNANAFLVDQLFYSGRKKINIVGAVGSHHYTNPRFVASTGGDDKATFSHQLQQTLREWLPLDCVRSARWLMLSVGQEFLYCDPRAESAQQGAGDLHSTGGNSYGSHPESLALYKALLVDPSRNVTMSTPDAELRAAVVTSDHRYVMLVVPQEGKLPRPEVLRLCEGILHVGDAPPHGTDVLGGATERRPSHRGLPSQVASGVALHRLCAVMHPLLRW